MQCVYLSSSSLHRTLRKVATQSWMGSEWIRWPCFLQNPSSIMLTFAPICTRFKNQGPNNWSFKKSAVSGSKMVPSMCTQKKHPRSPGITETPCLQQTFLVGRITASHRPSWGAALGPLGRSTQIHLLNHWRCTTGYPSEWRKLQKKSTKCWLQVRTQEPWGSILNVLPLWQPMRKNVFKPCVFHE